MNESNEFDESSYGMFLEEENNQEFVNENPTFPNQSDKLFDESNKCKSDQTPVNHCYFYEEDVSLSLSYNFEISTNQEIGLKNVQNPTHQQKKPISKIKKFRFNKKKSFSLKKKKNYDKTLLIQIKNKLLKLSKPSSKEFSSVTNAAKNPAWLKLKIKENCALGKDSNYEIFIKIENLVENEKSIKIKEFLEMILEDYYIQIFFDFEEFKKYCSR